MTKLEFTKIIKTLIRPMSLRKQKEVFKKFHIWLNELEASIFKDKFFCNKCEDYFSKRKIKEITKKETFIGECVYTDAGYGDDDRLADVTYLVYYFVCPRCDSLHYKEKVKLNEYNLRNRR